jgi:hypothetical protein
MNVYESELILTIKVQRANLKYVYLRKVTNEARCQRGVDVDGARNRHILGSGICSIMGREIRCTMSLLRKRSCCNKKIQWS